MQRLAAFGVTVMCTTALLLVGGSAASAQSFSTPVAVDPTVNAGEPGINVDHSGRIFVNAPGGLPGPSHVWRSTDGGATWTSTGPGNVGLNPSAPAANVTIGGGDSNVAVDAMNNLYFIDEWVGDASSAVSHDAGANWTGVPFGTVPVQDRPWVAADPRPGHAGTVYSVAEQEPTGLWLSRAIPGLLPGAVYPLSLPEITNVQRGIVGVAAGGNIVTDMRGTTRNVYAIFTGAAPGMWGIGLSTLPAGALSTTNTTVVPATGAYDQTQAFPVVAVDDAADNNIYVVWTDPTPSSWNIRFASFNGSSWSNPVTVGHGVYPWITAGAPGNVDIGWYSAAPSYTGDPNAAPPSTTWNVDFAQSLNALSSTPTFSAPVAATGAVKSGAICTHGLGCTADRELLDFMSITHDASGNALIAFTFAPNGSNGTSSGVGRIEFTKQTSGTGIG
jgi:hypothetical protein